MALDRDNVIRKIQAALKLADGTTNEGEMQAALQAAHRLLEKYNLSMTDVELKRDIEEMVTVSAEEFTRTYRWIWDITKAIDLLCNTESFRTGGGWSFKMHFCGTQTDVAAATSMFSFLYETIQKMGKAAKYPGIKERNSYCNGVGCRVRQRAHEFNRNQLQQPEGQTTYAIVHVKRDAVQKYVADNYRICNVKSPAVSKDRLAYAHGYHDGKKVPLSVNKALPG